MDWEGVKIVDIENNQILRQDKGLVSLHTSVNRISKTRLFKYIEIFYNKKSQIFR